MAELRLMTIENLISYDYLNSDIRGYLCPFHRCVRCGGCTALSVLYHNGIIQHVG